MVYWASLVYRHCLLNATPFHFCSIPWTQMLLTCLSSGMKSHGTSPIRPSCCRMDWSEQADGTCLRGCAASTGATRSWAIGLSCPRPSPSSSLSTRPSTTKTHYAGSTTSTADKLKAGWKCEKCGTVGTWHTANKCTVSLIKQVRSMGHV